MQAPAECHIMQRKIKVRSKRACTNGEHDDATHEEKQSECNLPAHIGDGRHNDCKESNSKRLKKRKKSSDHNCSNLMKKDKQTTTHFKGARCDRRECWGVNREGISVVLS